jgi:hypothetical protein
MDVLWQEREHEDVDNHVMEDSEAMNSLHDYGFLKHFTIPNLQEQKQLLQMLIGYWEQEIEAFIVDNELPKIEVEDTYFIIGLSQHGSSVNLKGGGHGTSTLTIQEYVNTYYSTGTQKMSFQVPINNIEDLRLKIILLMLSRVSSSSIPHLYFHPQMYNGVYLFYPTIFDQCTRLLTNMKSNLIDCRMG